MKIDLKEFAKLSKELDAIDFNQSATTVLNTMVAVIMNDDELSADDIDIQEDELSFRTMVAINTLKEYNLLVEDIPTDQPLPTKTKK